MQALLFSLYFVLDLLSCMFWGEGEGQPLWSRRDARHLLNAFNPAAQLPSDALVAIPRFLSMDSDLFTHS